GVPEPVDALHRLAQLLRGAEDHLCLLLGAWPDLRDAVARNVPRGLVDVVADVVEGGGEFVHVIPVERSHEGPVEQIDELACQAVALVLELLDVAEQPVAAREFLQQLDEQAGDLDRIPGRAAVQDVELTLLRDEGEPCHGAGVCQVSSPPDTGPSQFCNPHRAARERIWTVSRAKTALVTDEARLLNRELSWLDYNARVLARAADPGLPALERSRSCAYFSSNLDEFFQVRV